MATGFKFIERSQPSVLEQLPQVERDKIRRNAEAARERLMRERADGETERLFPDG